MDKSDNWLDGVCARGSWWLLGSWIYIGSDAIARMGLATASAGADLASVASYCWIWDQTLALPALLHRAYRTTSRRVLGALGVSVHLDRDHAVHGFVSISALSVAGTGVANLELKSPPLPPTTEAGLRLERTD